ncbi:MAG: CocE/NonD family hydrolase, partial [bacterium]
ATMTVCDGIIRAQYRESIWESPQPITPRQVYEYDIELEGTAYVFQAGHRIRVLVTSSSFPMWDRNLNTGDVRGVGTELRVAEQTVYHDRDHPSHISLPIAPAD